MTQTSYPIFVAPLGEAWDEAVSEKRLPSCSSPRHPPQLGRPWRRYPRPARASSCRPSQQQQPEHLTSPTKRSSNRFEVPVKPPAMRNGLREIRPAPFPLLGNVAALLVGWLVSGCSAR